MTLTNPRRTKLPNLKTRTKNIPMHPKVRKKKNQMNLDLMKNPAKIGLILNERLPKKIVNANATMIVSQLANHTSIEVTTNTDVTAAAATNIAPRANIITPPAVVTRNDHVKKVVTTLTTTTKARNRRNNCLKFQKIISHKNV